MKKTISIDVDTAPDSYAGICHRGSGNKLA